MKKVFIVSLLLVIVFLIGNAEMALAENGGGCHWYRCTGKYSCGSGIESEWVECVGLCIYEVYAELYSDWFECDLGGRSLFSSNKNFVGIGSGYVGDLGCAVDLRGNSMTADLYEDDHDCMDQLRCVVDESCYIY